MLAMTHSLQDLSTFRIQASAQDIVTLETLEDIQTLIQDKTLENYDKHMILWWGSNVVFAWDFEGLIVVNHLSWKEILSETDTTLTIQIASWENRNEFVHWTLDQDLSGIENLVMIPGSVWGAPVQNIWAYGVELRDSLMHVTWIDLTSGEILTFNNEECEFGYRDSIFKHTLQQNFFITSIALLLHKTDQNYNPRTHYADIETVLGAQGRDGVSKLRPRDIAEAVSYLRSTKLPDPSEIGTVGSFFQNPIIPTDEFSILKDRFAELKWFPHQHGFTKLSAWQLIDLCGLKWSRHGNVGVYDRHALVLVNYGSSTKGDEILELIHHVQDQVYEKFGIRLVPEVNVI